MELDFSKPENLQTRDGRPVRIYATDGSGVWPIHGAVLTEEDWSVRSWHADGKYSGSDACDLVVKPPRVTGWVNVYMGCNKTGYATSNSIYATKEEAIQAQVACLGQIYIDSEIQK